MKAHNELVKSKAQVEALRKELLNQELLALDTEFLREKTFFPQAALIQVATRDQSWLIDPLELSNEELEPFLDILAQPKILKILHAAASDQEVFYSNFGVLAVPSVDTAVAASLCGFGESAGLARLVREMLNVHLPKGHSRTDWTSRPLPQQLLKYAHQDVQFLIPLYEKLAERLGKMGRLDWALELSRASEDKNLYDINPERLAARLVRAKNLDRKINARDYQVLIEIMHCRESRARELNIPRRRVFDDDVLMDLWTARPKDLEHLAAFRGLNRQELKNGGERIVAAIHRGESLPEAQLKPVPKFDQAEEHEEDALGLLQFFIKKVAEKNELSVKHVISSENILKLLRGKFQQVQDFEKAGLLSHGACKLIGDDVLGFLSGKIHLSLQGGKLVFSSK